MRRGRATITAYKRWAAGLLAVLVLFAAGCAAPSLPTENFRSPVRTPAPTPIPTPEPTPEPVLAPVEDLPEQIQSVELMFGSRGEDVTNLQKRLIELGYLQRQEPDDYFDIVVEGAVKLFQRAVELEATGVAGIATLTKLFASDAPAKASAFPAQDPYNPGAAGRDVTLYQTPVPGGSPVRATPPRTSELPASTTLRIGLDPGHQTHANSAQEPVAPGSATTKNKVTSGTAGTVTGTEEYAVNLAVGLKVRDLLQALGIDVVMTRETNDVDISNSERAQMMNEAGVDLVVRLHCNGDSDSSRNGAFILIPSGSYTTGIQAESRSAAEDVLAAYIEATGANNLGLSERSDQTGFNWSTVPVINIEMGHLSNAAEEQLLTSSDYQNKMAQGIVTGIVRHFS